MHTYFACFCIDKCANFPYPILSYHNGGGRAGMGERENGEEVEWFTGGAVVD